MCIYSSLFCVRLFESILDAAIFALMSRVNKVIIGTHAGASLCVLGDPCSSIPRHVV